MGSDQQRKTGLVPKGLDAAPQVMHDVPLLHGTTGMTRTRALEHHPRSDALQVIPDSPAQQWGAPAVGQATCWGGGGMQGMFWAVQCRECLGLGDRQYPHVNPGSNLGFPSSQSRGVQFSSVQFSRSVVSNSLQSHGLQHARPPCPSPTPRVYSNSCPSSW